MAWSTAENVLSHLILSHILFIEPFSPVPSRGGLESSWSQGLLAPNICSETAQERVLVSRVTQFTHIVEYFPEPVGCGSIVDRPCSQGAHVPVREPGHKPDAVVTALVLGVKSNALEAPRARQSLGGSGSGEQLALSCSLYVQVSTGYL